MNEVRKTDLVVSNTAAEPRFVLLMLSILLASAILVAVPQAEAVEEPVGDADVIVLRPPSLETTEQGFFGRSVAGDTGYFGNWPTVGQQRQPGN